MVDNRYNPYKGLGDRCVESLMPKGVEHAQEKLMLVCSSKVSNL